MLELLYYTILYYNVRLLLLLLLLVLSLSFILLLMLTCRGALSARVERWPRAIIIISNSIMNSMIIISSSRSIIIIIIIIMLIISINISIISSSNSSGGSSMNAGGDGRSRISVRRLAAGLRIILGYSYMAIIIITIYLCVIIILADNPRI